MRGRLVEDRIEERICKIRVIDGVIANYYPQEELIRCKDCKHWLPHTQFGYDADYDEYHNYCERHLPDDDFYAFIKEAEDYCSWAERKEE